MTDRKVYLADGEPLSEELLNMGPSEFQLVEREEEIILDADIPDDKWVLTNEDFGE